MFLNLFFYSILIFKKLIRGIYMQTTLAEDIDSYEKCILCGQSFTIGEDGTELGFCIECQESDDFPYDLDAYYKAYDEGKVSFKGFETLDRGILEPFRKENIENVDDRMIDHLLSEDMYQNNENIISIDTPSAIQHAIDRLRSDHRGDTYRNVVVIDSYTKHVKFERFMNGETRRNAFMINPIDLFDTEIIGAMNPTSDYHDMINTMQKELDKTVSQFTVEENNIMRQRWDEIVQEYHKILGECANICITAYNNQMTSRKFKVEWD
jgi:hypothetical protein